MFKNPFFKNKGPFALRSLIYNKKTGLNSEQVLDSLPKDILISDIQTALMACSAAIEQRTKVGASLNTMQKEVDSIEKTREMMKNIILSNKVYLKP